MHIICLIQFIFTPSNFMRIKFIVCKSERIFDSHRSWSPHQLVTCHTSTSTHRYSMHTSFFHHERRIHVGDVNATMSMWQLTIVPTVGQAVCKLFQLDKNTMATMHLLQRQQWGWPAVRMWSLWHWVLSRSQWNWTWNPRMTRRALLALLPRGWTQVPVDTLDSVDCAGRNHRGPTCMCCSYTN